MCPSLSNLKKWKRKERRCCLKVELTITQFLHLTFLSFLLSQSSVWCVWTLLDLQPAALLVITWFRSSPTSSFSLSLHKTPSSSIYYRQIQTPPYHLLSLSKTLIPHPSLPSPSPTRAFLLSLSLYILLQATPTNILFLPIIQPI